MRPLAGRKRNLREKPIRAHTKSAGPSVLSEIGVSGNMETVVSGKAKRRDGRSACYTECVL